MLGERAQDPITWYLWKTEHSNLSGAHKALFLVAVWSFPYCFIQLNLQVISSEEDVLWQGQGEAGWLQEERSLFHEYIFNTICSE